MLEQIRYRAKALIAAAGLIIVGLAEYVVEAPDTAHVLEQALPAPSNQIVPLLLAGLAAGLVHAVPNAPRPGDAGALTVAQADAIRKLIDDHLQRRISTLSSRRAPAAPARATMDGAVAQVSTQPAPAEPAPTGIVQLLPPLGGGN